MHCSNDLAEASNARKNLCLKCRSAASIVLRRKDNYCIVCFRKNFSHKFRSALGREKLFRAETPVLVEVSGSAASISLVDVVLEAADMKNRKRLKMHPAFVHILFSLEEHDPSILSALIAYVQRTGCPCYVVDIAAIFAESIKEQFSPSDNEATQCPYGQQQFQDLCNSCASDTVLGELVYRLKMALLYRIAHCLKINFVLLDSTSTVLSAGIVSNVAQGRGLQIADEVATVDRRWIDVHFLRPLREFTIEEAALFNFYSEQRQVAFPVYPQRFLASPRATSVQAASNEFVKHLQMEFSSTITTLIASASKFQEVTPKPTSSDVARCVLCSSGTNAELLRAFDTFRGRFCYGCASLMEQIDAKPLMASVVAIIIKEKYTSEVSHSSCLPYPNK